jgi:hypothetical protein
VGGGGGGGGGGGTRLLLAGDQASTQEGRQATRAGGVRSGDARAQAGVAVLGVMRVLAFLAFVNESAYTVFV